MIENRAYNVCLMVDLNQFISKNKEDFSQLRAFSEKIFYSSTHYVRLLKGTIQKDEDAV